MLAVKRPSAASLSCWACSRKRPISSRNTRTSLSEALRREQSCARNCDGTRRHPHQKRFLFATVATPLDEGPAPAQASTTVPARHSFASGEAEQLPGARIALPDPAIAAEYDHAVLHLLEDPLADHRLIVQIHSPLQRQCFVGDNPASQQSGGNRYGKEAGTEQTRR
jgi:hypothetical protein